MDNYSLATSKQIFWKWSKYCKISVLLPPDDSFTECLALMTDEKKSNTILKEAKACRVFEEQKYIYGGSK